MALLGAQFVIALEPSSVAGAQVSRGFGSARVRSLARVALAPGSLEVSAFEMGVHRPDEVRAAIARVLAALGAGGSPACLVLPDGLARLALLEVPEGAAPERYARFRLMGGLPYPPEEALVDVLPLGGQVLAAAVRRSVVQGFEELARSAGVVQDRIDLAPLAALSALRAAPPAGPSFTADLVMGEAAVSMLLRDGAAVRGFRNRRRDTSSGEAQRLLAEIDRTAVAAGDGAVPPRVRVLGAGAAGLVAAWREQGRTADLGWSVALPEASAEAAEMSWLGAALS